MATSSLHTTVMLGRVVSIVSLGGLRSGGPGWAHSTLARQPIPQRHIHGKGPLQRGEVAATLHHDEPGARYGLRHFASQWRRRDAVVVTDKDKRRAGDPGQQRAG